MSALFYTQIDDSPVGPLLLAGDADALHVLSFGMSSAGGRHERHVSRRTEIDAQWIPDTKGVLTGVRQELDAYFAGRLKQFSTALAFNGTAFQNAVWKQLTRIPYGETISYLELAKRIDNPKAVRAVGLANGANPIAIIVPCHRVIGSNGSLTGFGGGLPTKRALLDLERGQRTLL
ncbi:MAG TPA: methylated-DNA--[protein]-cysteine S-methyltransferase [Vicinamibacterales bacterium]|nr:methylated-DNA--[protein]-cysteine S-methyltransferase [Vicinamibacterales bacterium]